MNGENNNNLINGINQNSPIIKADINLIFAGDSFGLFVFKKTERIVTAIYLLTGLMSDKEPMKEKLRDLATRMLENSLAMSERVWGEEIFQKNLIATTCEITVLFNIAEKTKMISSMNHKIMNSEIEKLSDFLVTSAKNYSSAKVAFDPNMFDGDYNYVPEQGYKTVISDLEKIAQVNSFDFYKGQKDIKDNLKNTVFEKMSLKKIDENSKVIKDKSNRQEIILAMLKGGMKLTIKDFAKNIKGCSEKTIQRELISMVGKGVLKKEGERRWSKYFLA